MFGVTESCFTLHVLPVMMRAKWGKAILSPTASPVSLRQKECICMYWREKVAQSFRYTSMAMKMALKSACFLITDE